MNKQELIDKLKRLLEIPSEMEGYDFEYGHDFGIRRAISLAKRLDEQQTPSNEPKKPIVPQFVADWIEWCKKNKITLLGADTAICNNKNISPLDASGWAMKNQETFVKAWLYGYEIEKEKLYTVEIPNPDYPDKGKFVLCKNKSGKVFIKWTCLDDLEFLEEFQLIEAEIKKDFEWAWQFAKEVEQCNQRL